MAVSSTTAIYPRHHDVPTMLAGLHDPQLRDGLLFRSWAPQLSGDLFLLILTMRDYALAYEEAQRHGGEWVWPTQSEIATRVGVSERTLRNWLSACRAGHTHCAALHDEQQWLAYLAQLPTGSPQLLAVFLHVTPGTYYQNARRQARRLPDCYWVELHTPLLPRHQLALLQLDAEQQMQATQLPIAQLLELLDSLSVEYAGNFCRDTRTEYAGNFCRDTLSPSSPLPDASLSTSSPPATGKNCRNNMRQFLPEEDPEDQEDHYDEGEDLRLTRQHAFNEALAPLFTDRDLLQHQNVFALEVRNQLRPRSMAGLQQTVVAIFMETGPDCQAGYAPERCLAVLRRMHLQERKRRSEYKNPTSVFLVALRRELGLPDYPARSGSATQ